MVTPTLGRDGAETHASTRLDETSGRENPRQGPYVGVAPGSRDYSGLQDRIALFGKLKSVEYLVCLSWQRAWVELKKSI